MVEFIPARNFTAGRIKKIRLIVIHTAEYPERSGAARAVAEYFAGPKAPQASAHFIVDSDAVIQCVMESNTAWAAPGANADGLQIEHAGYTAQSASDWSDPYSTSMLNRSAALTASLAKKYGVPAVHLTNDQLQAGAAGFIGHLQASQVYHLSDHTDPGPNFPWDRYMQLVRSGSSDVPPSEDDMNLQELAGWDMSGQAGEPSGTVNFQTLLGRIYKATVKNAASPMDVNQLATEIVNQLAGKLPVGSYTKEDLALAICDEMSRRLAS